MFCKNCVHWKRGAGGKLKFGLCNSEKFVYTGTFDNINHIGDELEYWDCESYKAGFETGENFGCIHFINN